MLSLLACVVIQQTPTQMSAEEIRQRLEAPVTLRTDPVRMSVALDEIGARVGVRIRCESELQPAVVVVGVKNKPAKEVVKHLVDGIGASSAIVNGTVIVGMRSFTGEEAEKQRVRQLQAIKSTIENRAKQLNLDEPIDPQIAPRTAALVMTAIQNVEAGYRPPYQQMYEAAQKSPLPRLAVGLMRAVGPENLRPEDDRPRLVTMRGLDAARAKKAQGALDTFADEQRTWSKAFEPAIKLAVSKGEGYFNDELFNRSISIDDAKPDGFSITITNTAWGRSVVIEVLSGSETVFSVNEALPKERVYTNPGGEYFPQTKGAGIKAELGKFATFVMGLRKSAQEGKPMLYDHAMMKQIADPWRNEPIALTLVQPLADVAAKLDLNTVVFLGDNLLGSVAYGYNYLDPTQIPGEQVLNLATGVSGGLRKRGDWLLGYCSNPEAYLENQIDRIALGKFLTRALKPGALTFEQFLAARKEMTINQMNVARQFARIVRPGFDSLNPISMEMLEIFGALKPGQLSQAQSGGIPFASLAPELQNRFRAFIGYQRRRARYQPDDSIDAPPTMQDIVGSKIFLTRTSRYGAMILNGANLKSRTYNPYISYSFRDFDQFRGFRTVEEILVQFNQTSVWLAQIDSIQFRVDIQRRRPQGFGTAQYITDVTTTPLTTNQLGQALSRYFAGD